jgi:putative addiction module component (TIGR02574 family)
MRRLDAVVPWRMLPDPQKLLDEAMKLPASTRARLVGRLLETLDLETLDDGEDEGVEEAWDTEIARRVTELDEGKVVPVPWAEVRRELRARQGR